MPSPDGIPDVLLRLRSPSLPPGGCGGCGAGGLASGSANPLEVAVAHGVEADVAVAS